MTPGANLSHAARCAFDAQRALIAAAVHLEAADAVLVDLDQRLAEAGLADTNVADALEDLGLIAGSLQGLADAFGHDHVRCPLRPASQGRAGCAK